ncbi:hypothetical protein [Roseibium aggregatum]|uniref:Uncharacterized protein n=1 Tax=Roseibium aggregatum TaxID=187304 RepID=A0A939EK64_9HYPH|nr:hypothetical protein [Roseibium aggregatum]MBN9673823.1 hypothetical protein [Roseibium aggregatum]
MLYTAYVAVCLATMPVQDCNRDTAVDWMVAPGHYDLAHCMVHGQRFASTSGIVRDGDTVKVYCKAPDQFRSAG